MKTLPSLTPALTSWALAQPVFFIASAPRHGRHINLSPKGMPASSLAILSPNLVAYVDRTGSGCETIAHLYENARATLMFMSLGRAPRILRLFCTGRVVEAEGHTAAEAALMDGGAGGKGSGDGSGGGGGGEFARWLARMACPHPAGARAIIVLRVFLVTTSCGYGVPRVRRALYSAGGGRRDEEEEVGEEEGEEGEGSAVGVGECSVFEDRPTLDDRLRQLEGKTPGGVVRYQAQKNVASLDGLPGLRAGRRAAGRWLWVGDGRAWARRAAAETNGLVVGFTLAVLLYYLVTTHMFGIVALLQNQDRIGILRRQMQKLMG